MLKQYVTDLKQEFAGYSGAKLVKDILAGLTVAAVALPLALAFGVSSGADAAADVEEGSPGALGPPAFGLDAQSVGGRV